MDSYRVTLCAWRAAAPPEQPQPLEQAFSPAVACPSPPGTATYVADARAPP